MVGVPFDGRISGFGSVSGVFFGSWRTNVLVSVRIEVFRLSRSVSTLAGVISSVSGVADLHSTRSVPFRPSFRGIFVSLGVVSTLSHPVSTLLPSGFSSLPVGFDTL